MPKIRRGHWRAGYPPGVHQMILVLLTFELVLRGMDYFTGDRTRVVETLSTVEKAMPLQWWGLLCLTAAATLIAGIIGRWVRFVITGALLASGIYGGLAWGTMLTMFEHGCRPTVEVAPAYATVWGGITVALLVAALFASTRPRAVGLMLLAVACGTWALIIALGAVDEVCAWDGYRTPAHFTVMSALWHGIAYGTSIRGRAMEKIKAVA